MRGAGGAGGGRGGRGALHSAFFIVTFTFQESDHITACDISLVVVFISSQLEIADSKILLLFKNVQPKKTKPCDHPLFYTVSVEPPGLFFNI